MLHLTPEGVTVDAYQAGECDAPPVVDAGWVGAAGCTLRVQRTTGPCGGGAYRSALDLTLTLGGSSGGGQAIFGEAPGGDPLPEGMFAATAELHPADAACVAPAPEPEQPGIFGNWALEGTAQVSGEVVVDSVEMDDETLWVTVYLADGEDPIQVPLSPDHPAPPAGGDTLWLDGETVMPFWVEGAYVLRVASDGPLVAAGIAGSWQWLDDGPWARAGQALGTTPACAPAWLSLDCGELATFYRVSVGAPDARALSAGIGGGHRRVTHDRSAHPGGPARLPGAHRHHLRPGAVHRPPRRVVQPGAAARRGLDVARSEAPTEWLPRRRTGRPRPRPAPHLSRFSKT